MPKTEQQKLSMQVFRSLGNQFTAPAAYDRRPGVNSRQVGLHVLSFHAIWYCLTSGKRVGMKRGGPYWRCKTRKGMILLAICRTNKSKLRYASSGFPNRLSLIHSDGGGIYFEAIHFVQFGMKSVTMANISGLKLKRKDAMYNKLA